MKLLTFVALATTVWAQSPGPAYGTDVPASCSQIPDDLSFRNRTYALPDPFRLLGGKRVKTLAEWQCRAAQIRELLQVRPSNSHPRPIPQEPH